jgi:hypothetical protein
MTKKEIYNELLRIRTQIRCEDRKKAEEITDELMNKLVDDMDEEGRRVPTPSIGGQMVRAMIANAERSKF